MQSSGERGHWSEPGKQWKWSCGDGFHVPVRHRSVQVTSGLSLSHRRDTASIRRVAGQVWGVRSSAPAVSSVRCALDIRGEARTALHLQVTGSSEEGARGRRVRRWCSDTRSRAGLRNSHRGEPSGAESSHGPLMSSKLFLAWTWSRNSLEG